ncbi:MAG: hypothetical protein CVT83_01155 [Alphaproteobacteria bacterium HGW-Alphaproteobacteria-5]|jgi:mannose-6-phosphate isomerase-like protein (cupin superfamily)|nr:MAG: hypothetical protein CVT83_01155 [Alphaproteobacteria bacterium HGW-Alphaproteobacteria-5]
MKAYELAIALASSALGVNAAFAQMAPNSPAQDAIVVDPSTIAPLISKNRAVDASKMEYRRIISSFNDDFKDIDVGLSNYNGGASFRGISYIGHDEICYIDKGMFVSIVKGNNTVVRAGQVMFRPEGATSDGKTITKATSVCFFSPARPKEWAPPGKPDYDQDTPQPQFIDPELSPSTEGDPALTEGSMTSYHAISRNIGARRIGADIIFYSQGSMIVKRAHPTEEIWYVAEGAGAINCAGTDKPFREGQFIALRAGSRCDLRLTKDSKIIAVHAL